MGMDESYHIYKLLKVKGVGRVLVNKMLTRLSEVGKQMTRPSLEDFAIDELRNWLDDEQIVAFKTLDSQLYEQISQLQEQTTNVVTVSDPNYPKALSLALGNSRPPALSCVGNLRLLEMPSVGFCGSRKASERGLDVAQDCVEQLVQHEVAIVSGYAAGIDQQVHLTALGSGGSTIIVLPEGVLNFKVRKVLRENWDWDRVLVISEFLPDDVWLSSRAMQRNNTIVALSNVMVLIEAAKRGGSVDAGRKTLKLRKTLYVPCYENMQESAGGNEELLGLGATPLLKDRRTGKANLNLLIDDIKNIKGTDDVPTKQLTFL